MSFNPVIRGFALAVLSLCAIQLALAQTRAKPPEESCPDGYYGGPRAGRNNYANDKYIWVVTPEFAKRFCMPLEMVDETLKGAEAIAFKMSTRTGLTDRCSVFNGKTRCAGNHELRFDIFLRHDLKLPAAHPEVEFFDGSWDDAGWNITANFRKERSQKRFKGTYQYPSGTLPHFASYDLGKGYKFLLSGIQQNRKGYVIADFHKEWRYEAHWNQDLDLVVLQDSLVGDGFINNPAFKKLGINHFALVLKKDQSGNLSDRLIPEEFEYTITLPDAFMDKVRAAASGPGMSWEEQINLLRQQ